MLVYNLIEAISAAHLSFYVVNEFPERSGIHFVGPPASLKTAVTETLQNYPNALLSSDLTIKQGVRLRDDLISQRITTIAFLEFAKLYKRHSATASNIEGFIHAIVAEGFRHANWEETRVTIQPARATVIGCMTPSFCQAHFGEWLDSGFARRFLWSHFRLHDPNIIIEAIISQMRIDFTRNGSQGFNPRQPITRGAIKFNCVRDESERLFAMLANQPGRELGLILLQKMLSVLKWKFPNSNKPWEVLDDFSQSLTSHGAELIIPPNYKKPKEAKGPRRFQPRY